MSFSHWQGGKPGTFDELFRFYDEYVKLLYSYTESGGELPQEMLLELNAAFDHLSRHWVYSEDEQAVCDKMFAHLKRSCLDVFKLQVMETCQQYGELRKIDTSVIDNGDFDKGLHETFNQIRSKATEARRREGKTDRNDEVPAFTKWEEVFLDCLKFRDNFFLHSKVDWAKRQGRGKVVQNICTHSGGTIIGGTVVYLLSEPFEAWVVIFPLIGLILALAPMWRIVWNHKRLGAIMRMVRRNIGLRGTTSL